MLIASALSVFVGSKHKPLLKIIHKNYHKNINIHDYASMNSDRE